jgi:hypothetical protein
MTGIVMCSPGLAYRGWPGPARRGGLCGWLAAAGPGRDRVNGRRHVSRTRRITVRMRTRWGSVIVPHPEPRLTTSPAARQAARHCRVPGRRAPVRAGAPEMTGLGVSCGPFVVNTQRHSRWIWDLRRARRDPAGSGPNDLDPQVLTLVLRVPAWPRACEWPSPRWRGEFASIGYARRGPRWCLMGAVGVEVRVRVTAPAEF